MRSSSGATSSTFRVSSSRCRTPRVAFDLDATAAATARRRVLDIVATDQTRVGGIHLDYPAFGHVVPAGEGYAFVPEVWRPVV